MEIYDSARRHGVADEDVTHAIEHALVVADDEENEKRLYLGPDRAGNLLEVVSVLTDDDREIVIHAMGMRPIYRSLLEKLGGDSDD